MRRLLRPVSLAIIGVSCVALYALVGFVLIPYVIERYVFPAVAEQLKRPVSVKEVEFNPFTLALRLVGVEVQEQDGSPVLGFEEFFTDERMCALGVPGEQVLLLFRRGATDVPAPAPDGFIPPHRGEGPLHLCFAIPYGELARWESHLRENDVPIESRLSWPHGGTSLYFRDPDDNSLEVATPGLWPNR